MLYIVAFLGVFLLIFDCIIMTKRYNAWYLQFCCKRAEKCEYKELIYNWIDSHIQADMGNEVIWRDISRAIKKDTGLKVDAGLLRGFMCNSGYKTVSNYVIDTYIFNIRYKASVNKKG